MSDSEGQTSTDQAWNCDFPVESWTYILSKKMILKKKAYIGDCCPVLSVKISVTPAPTLQRGNWIQEYLCSGISPNWEMKSQVMLSECRISTLNFLEEEESQKRKNMELQCLKTKIFPCKQSRWLDLVNQAFIHLCQYQIFKIFSCLHKSQFVQFASQKFSRL